MTFSEYYKLLPESFIGELASKYHTLDMTQLQRDYPTMMQYCIDWSIVEGISNKTVRNRLETSTAKLFRWCAKYRPQAIQMLADLHELEYKQSQVKKFYSNPEALRVIDHTILKVAKWLQLYLNVVLFSRAAADGAYYLANTDAAHHLAKTAHEALDTRYERGDIPTPNEILNSAGFKKTSTSATTEPRWDNYVTAVFVELYNAKTLPQLLIAISKAKNAEHDGGAIMTDWGTGLFYGNESAFAGIGNLNYRKLDRELQQELSSH